MKTKIATVVLCIIIMVSLYAGDSVSNSSTPDAVAVLHKEVQDTQARLDLVTARVSQLEQQVRALETSNAELQQEVRKLQGPHLLLPPPQGLRVVPQPPQTNEAPHLTPLQVK